MYFDNSATTKIDPQVLQTYQTVCEKVWGNPSSLHNLGEHAFNLLEQARKQVADLIGRKQDEIFFTSGGTESDNWAIKGTAIEKHIYGKHLITSSVEHPAVINTMRQLEKLGFEVTYLPVDKEGRVSCEDLRKAIRKDTILVSIMAVNNEVGSIQPIDEIAEVLKDYPKIHFHVDAVQAVGKGLGKMLKNERIDLMSFSGHKFHAPRGIGFMYKKEGRMIAPLLTGGGQEKNLRSGTENLPAIAAMAKALRLVVENEDEYSKRQQKIKEKIYDHVKNSTKQSSSPDATRILPHTCFVLQSRASGARRLSMLLKTMTFTFQRQAHVHLRNIRFHRRSVRSELMTELQLLRFESVLMKTIRLKRRKNSTRFLMNYMKNFR